MNLLPAFVRRAAARLGGADRVDRRAALLDVRNFAVGVDHECRAVCDAGFLVQHPIGGRGFAFGEIAQKRNGDIVLLRELSL
jgi:hypothetical protein